MKNVGKFVVILSLYGCSGEFTTFSGQAELDAADSAPMATGGAPGTGGATGGAPEVDAGGGGSPATGGFPATGGAPETGGVVGTGGLLATGGVVGTGGAPETGGAPVVDACAPVTHDNGLGQTWTDCVPLGTYDEAQAMKACRASDAALCLKSERCGPAVYEVQGFNADRSHLVGEWGYGSFATGYVSPDYNLCTPSDPARKIWD